MHEIIPLLSYFIVSGTWSTSSNNQKDLLLHITVCSNAFALWVFLVFIWVFCVYWVHFIIISGTLNLLATFRYLQGEQPTREKRKGRNRSWWGDLRKRDQEFSQPVSQGDSASSRRSSISQPIFDKQMNSATELQSASFYSVLSWERDDLSLP